MKKNLIKSYLSDASQMKGKASDVLLPRNIGEVEKAIAKNDKITIRGAGTGLAGGAVPQGEVILDLSKLVKISDFDKDRKTIVAEAGVILDDLQAYVAPYDLEFPVKPSSHAVCTIGGMIATDAVGNRGVKYGNTSTQVKWIEVVDSAGRLQRKGITEMSDYVGMEGITGVIVRACLKLSEIKLERSASLFRVKSLGEVVEMVGKLKRNLDVCAIEFLDRMVSEGVGFGKDYHLLVEFEGDKGGLKGEDYLKVMRMRDMAYPFVAGEGYKRIEDPKVMVSKFPILMEWLEKKKIPTFGHVGVGILHPCFNAHQERYVPEMMKLVSRLGGKVSGEHGIGLLKRGFVEINDQKIIRNVKKRCDPMNKFNVGKVI
jgi:glycolate oxidase